MYTGTPVILSQDYCGFLEPQKEVWEGEPGKKFHLPKLLENNYVEVLNQFHGICGYSKHNSEFKNQTLFRFPLRSSPSKLSDETYTLERL